MSDVHGRVPRAAGRESVCSLLAVSQAGLSQLIKQVVMLLPWEPSVPASGGQAPRHWEVRGLQRSRAKHGIFPRKSIGPGVSASMRRSEGCWLAHFPGFFSYPPLLLPLLHRPPQKHQGAWTEGTQTTSSWSPKTMTWAVPRGPPQARRSLFAPSEAPLGKASPWPAPLWCSLTH